MYFRHYFQINLSNQSSISSIRVKLSFATSECISDDATLSLYQLRNPAINISTGTSFAGSDNIEGWFEDIVPDLLCGPVPVKQFVDISDQSLVISLTHPRLLNSERHPVFLLCFDQLFVSRYSTITEEVSKSLASKATEIEPISSRSRRMQALIHRPRGGRRYGYPVRQPPPANNIHSYLQVTVFPGNIKMNTDVKDGVLECLFHEEIVTKLLMMACRYSIEEREFLNLDQCYQELCLKEQQREDSNGETMIFDSRQNDALSILCWMVSMAYCNGDR